MTEPKSCLNCGTVCGEKSDKQKQLSCLNNLPKYIYWQSKQEPKEQEKQEYEEKKNQKMADIEGTVKLAGHYADVSKGLDELEALALKQGERIGYEKGYTAFKDNSLKVCEICKEEILAEGKKQERERIKGIIEGMKKESNANGYFASPKIALEELEKRLKGAGK